MNMWFTEEFHNRFRVGVKVDQTVYSAQSEFQKIDIFDTPHFGRTLALDGIFMTSIGDEFYYHEMIAHPALVTAPKIDRVLIIGGGDGGTAREVLRHKEVKEVVLAEIDGMVVEACKKFMPEIGAGAWEDPRFKEAIGDGIKYVAEAKEGSFDVILLDGSDPVGPAEGLFGLDFYKNVKRVLAPDGVFALQSESPVVFEKLFFDTQKALRGVFEQVHPYFGSVPLYGAGMWTWTYCTKDTNPLEMYESRVIAAEKHAKYYNRDIHCGSFAVPSFVKNRLIK